MVKQRFQSFVIIYIEFYIINMVFHTIYIYIYIYGTPPHVQYCFPLGPWPLVPIYMGIYIYIYIYILLIIIIIIIVTSFKGEVGAKNESCRKTNEYQKNMKIMKSDYQGISLKAFIITFSALSFERGRIAPE